MSIVYKVNVTVKALLVSQEWKDSDEARRAAGDTLEALVSEALPHKTEDGDVLTLLEVYPYTAEEISEGD